MTALASTSIQSAKFQNVGDSVAGLIIDFSDVQEKGYVQGQPGAGKPKWWGKDGKPVELDAETAGAQGLNPMMQVRITLEQAPGNPDSRVNLFVGGARMKTAVRSALAEAGVNDITHQSQLRVTFTGYEGPAKQYSATYAPFDPTA